jgi:hypothetical protein
MTNTTNARLMVMTSTPHLKGKARRFGRDYLRIALVELEDGFQGRPKMISERAIGVRRIVRDYTVHVGSTERSAGYRLLRELEAMATV